MKEAVYLFLAEGFEELEAIAVVDFLRRAALTVHTVAVGKQREVRGAHGVTVTADGLFTDFDYEGAVMLILPGGMPGASNLAAHAGLTQLLQDQRKCNRWIAAICAAPAIVLGQQQLLSGHEAVCYPGFEDKLENAIVCTEPVKVSGKFITARGPGFAVDFARCIVEQLCGRAAADEVAQGMLLK